MITIKILSRKLVDWIVICVLFNSYHMYSCISINIYMSTVLLQNILLPHSPVLGARIAVKSMLVIKVNYWPLLQHCAIDDYFIHIGLGMLVFPLSIVLLLLL